jgi:hypothetical protein
LTSRTKGEPLINSVFGSQISEATVSVKQGLVPLVTTAQFKLKQYPMTLPIGCFKKLRYNGAPRC